MSITWFKALRSRRPEQTFCNSGRSRRPDHRGTIQTRISEHSHIIISSLQKPWFEAPGRVKVIFTYPHLTKWTMGGDLGVDVHFPVVHLFLQIAISHHFWITHGFSLENHWSNIQSQPQSFFFAHILSYMMCWEDCHFVECESVPKNIWNIVKYIYIYILYIDTYYIWLSF